MYGVRELFNAAFVSCWTELSDTQQDELIRSLEQALTSQDIPEITQTLLNLAEFMEHCDKVRFYCDRIRLSTISTIYQPRLSKQLLIYIYCSLPALQSPVLEIQVNVLTRF